MKTIILLSQLLLVVSGHTSVNTRSAHEAYDFYAIHLRSGVDPRSVAIYLELSYHGPLGELADHHIFRAEEKCDDYDHVKSRIREHKSKRRRRDADANLPHLLDSVLMSEKQIRSNRFTLKTRTRESSVERERDSPSDRTISAKLAARASLDITKDLNIQDSHFPNQWHLHNLVEIGHDINVTGVWKQGITGGKSTVCVVDDGLDMTNKDLRANYFAEGSWDFNDPGPDPMPKSPRNSQGTSSASGIAAVKNTICGVGVAYDSKIAGCRILASPISDADEAAALNFEFQRNDIYSCSWGPTNDGKTMEGPGILVQRALVNGVQHGRGGLGSIYVFGSGNGGLHDNCNFDGYANSIYSATVGSIDRKDKHPDYSEECAAQLIVAYSSDSGDAVRTIDIGKDHCSADDGRTPGAVSLVAGIYALMLDANPTLTWRDIQWLTVLAAVEPDEDPGDYQRSIGTGKRFSHRVGYGKADAYALVEAAKTWTNVGPQAWYFTPTLHVHHAIPQGEQGLVSRFEVTEAHLRLANLARLEHVSVTVNIEHTRRGDLSLVLQSPSGMISYIATKRSYDDVESGFVEWTFMSVAHWGEAGIGTWTLFVQDQNINKHTGVFGTWRLKLWGEAIDGLKQPLFALPTNHDDKFDPGFDEVSNPSPTNTHTDNPSSRPLPNPFWVFSVGTRGIIAIVTGFIILLILSAVGVGGLCYKCIKKRHVRRQVKEMIEQDSDDDDTPSARGKRHRRGLFPWRTEHRGGKLYGLLANREIDDIPD